MIRFLRAKNLALIDEVAVDFASGFTAVTGETGAGKSVLIGAMGLLSGTRADRSLIRSGAGACEVEAVLDAEAFSGIGALLEEMDLPA